MQRAPKKELFGWAMFDFANSSYTTVIITVVFSVIFPKIIVGDAESGYRMGNLLWSVALSVSYILVVVTAPILGAIMDHSASKKRFLFYSYVLVVLATASLYFVQPGMVLLGMGIIVISNLAFASGEDFISSFLPELGPPEDLGKISGYAWGLGYFGGLFSTAIVMFGLGEHTAANYENLRLTGPITGAFFAVAAIPTFVLLKERAKPQALPPGEGYITIAFKRLGQTFRDIRDFRDLMVFLSSFFFAYAGLSIIISFAFIYGDQIINWSPTSQMLMFVITQFTAAGGAVLFGYLQDKLGAIRSYNLTMVLWIVSVLLIYFTDDLTAWINSTFGLAWKVEHFFLIVGSVAGSGLGATQSAARAMVGIFSPVTKSAEFFGFWGLAGKLSAVFGLLSLGSLQAELGLKQAILLTAAFFVVSFFLTLFVNEANGRAAARAHNGE